MRLLLFFALCALCLADFETQPLGAIPAALGGSTWPNYARWTQWWTLNGKTADPCASNEELDGIRRTDCVGTEWPAPAVTVLIPMRLTLGKGTPNGYTPGMQLTIRGKWLMGVQSYTQPIIPSMNSRLTLSKRNRDCDDPEVGNYIISAQCIAGSVAPNCDAIVFTIPLNSPWHDNQLEAEDAPRKLCWSRQATPAVGTTDTEWRYTGFKIGVVWDATNKADCANYANSILAAQVEPFVDSSFQAQQRRVLAAQAAAAPGDNDGFCRHRTFGREVVGNSVIIQYEIGQCILPNVQTCCGGTAVEKAVERCCDGTFELVQWYDQPCGCRASPNETNSPSCPTGETCCLPTKYDEGDDPSLFLSVLALRPPNQLAVAWPQFAGQCYNAATHRCCDTGLRYDPGVDQCCSINGIQSLTAPCPCNADTDCQGGQPVGQRFATRIEGGMVCCRQIWPEPEQAADDYILGDNNVQIPRCSKYANFPSGRATGPFGTAAYQTQRCLGSCIDTRYQMCCNGVVCRREYERCCNATCCNKYVGGCIEGQVMGTPGNYWNSNELDQYYELCTTIEYLTPLEAFWLFVWPAYLLLMTVICMAFVIAFVGKSSRRSFAFLERAIILVAFLTIIFAVCCFFAPIYKYGVWLVIVSLFAVVTAAARMRTMNGVLVVVQFITLMYLFDPLNGNDYLNFSSLRTPQGLPDPLGAGVLHSIKKIWPSVDGVRAQRYCTEYYNYFAYDSQLWDYRRQNPAKPTFGYCGDGWITALLIFEGIVLLLALVQFILALIAFVLRFREERSYDPIELEVRGVDEVVPVTPVVPVVPLY